MKTSFLTTLSLFLFLFLGCTSSVADEGKKDFEVFFQSYQHLELPLDLNSSDYKLNLKKVGPPDSLQIKFLGFIPEKQYGRVHFSNRITGILTYEEDMGDESVWMYTFNAGGEKMSSVELCGESPWDKFDAKISPSGLITRTVITYPNPENGSEGIEEKIAERFQVNSDGIIAFLDKQ